MIERVTAHLYGLSEEVGMYPTFDKPVVAFVAASESALGVLRANLMPSWTKYVCVEPAKAASVSELREVEERAAEARYAMVEPERALRGGRAIERAIHSFITDGALAKVFMFVRGAKGVVKLKETRALDCVIESRLERKTDDIAEVALAILRERGKTRGADLLRESRERYGSASTRDAERIASVLVEAWHSSQAKLMLE